MAHGQWNEIEARAVLAAQKKSGLSIMKFAAERGMNNKRLYWWKRRLEVKASVAATNALALLPVHVAEPRRGEPVTILLRSGHMMKVGRGFDEEALERAVAVLERA